MSSIEEIKERLDIVDVVSETVDLRRSGKNYTAFCPFHSNTRTPSFVVFPETGTWRCFGQCAEGGDIFKFVMKRDGWDFPEALEKLAERAGVELKPTSPQDAARKEEYAHLRKLLEEAVTFYRHHLTQTESGKPALDYLMDRELSQEIVAIFELGYAPKGWDNSYKHFKEKGYSEKDMLDAGLISKRESGGYYDRFRDRIIFPIRDGRGKMAGFGARTIDPDEQPKYLNSPQTVLFDKSRLLYGLDKARKPIRSQDEVVIVEGYLDVIAPYQHGFTNLVSSMGTALTEHQFRALKKLTRKMILALDADAAGAKATLRGLEVARQSLDRETDPSFDASNILHMEARLKADIRVTTLPEGMDPDDIVRKDPQEWSKLVAEAKPVVEHVMDTLASGQNLKDPKIKSEITAQVMPLIRDLPSAIERDTYVQQLARMLKVDEGALMSEQLPPSREKRRRPRNPLKPVGQQQPTTPYQRKGDASSYLLETFCLGILMRHPEILYRLDRALQGANLERLHREDFQLTDHQEMFKNSLEALNQDYLEPLNFVLDNLPEALLLHAEEILIASEKIDPENDEVLRNLLRAVLRLRQNNLRDGITQLRFLMEDAQDQGNLITDDYMKTMDKSNLSLFNVQKALHNQLANPS